MKERAVARSADRAWAPPTRPPVRAAAPPPVHTTSLADRDPDGPTLLDHLSPGRLAGRWTRATRDSARPLPGRADLERRFGASLTGVRVHSGPAVRSLLDHLDARGAASGDVILLRDPADAVTAAHEVAHVLQAGGPGAGATLPAGVPLPPDHPAEREAEALARRSGPARLRARLVPGALALRRTALLVRDPDPAAGGPPALTDLRPDPAEPEPVPARAPAEGVDQEVPEPEAPEEQPEPGPARAVATEAPDTGEEPGTGEAPGPAEAPATRAAPGPTQAGGRQRAAPPAPARDRRLELRQVIIQTQGTWDAGRRTVKGQDLVDCPALATAPDARPFARGPPPAAPPVRPREELPEPQLPEPDTTEVDHARDVVRRQVDVAPARAPPPDLTALDDDQRRVRADGQRRLDDHIRETTRTPLREVRSPAVAREGSADPARAPPVERAFRERADEAAAAARRQATQDFGERRLAPARDPTAGHDRHLDGVEVPEVDVDGQIQQARFDLVATDQNVGTVPIGQVVLVPDADLARLRQQADGVEDTRARVDTDIEKARGELGRTCDESGRERDALRVRARDGVARHRREWTTAGDELVERRGREAQEIRRSRLATADTVQRDANARADRVVADARVEASRQWDEARTRARSAAQRSADRSWFQRGLDWAREQIARLVDWIDSFLVAVRRAITAVLDAAAALGHRIVTAAHRVISGLLDGMAALLDLLAANLPGELGELGRRYVDRIHAFLADAQAALDDWAADLHRTVDRTIDGLKTVVRQVLDELRAGVQQVAADLDALLANGLMAFLRQQFPTLAALLDDGLDAAVDAAAGRLDAWVTTALEVTGLADLERTLDELQIDAACAERATQESAEERVERCAAFQQRLQGALAVVDEMLASPAAQQIQDFLRRHAQEEAAAQLDAVVDFFDFVHAVAAPVYRWWEEIRAGVATVLDTLGEVARTVWRHVAVALGIDPDIDPVEALRRGIQSLWATLVDGLRPLLDGLRAAWRWLSEESPLAPLFDLFARLPQLWTALQDLAGRVVSGAGAWLARAAETLAGAVLPLVTDVLQAVTELARTAAGVVSAWGSTVLGVVEAILTWRPGLALLDAVLRAVDRITAPVRRLLAAVLSCLTATVRFVAGLLRELARDARRLLDVAVGLVLALATFPVGLVAFLAGNVWLHVLPDCYKPAILNFLLDVAIRFVRFLPEPADVGLLILHQGLLNFLQGLRAAPDAQKVGAVDLLASLYAGNAEFAAGFIVGTLAGIWDSTAGTVVFLLQAVVWLMQLPFKLTSWAVGSVTGTLRPEPGEDGGGDEPEADAASVAETTDPRADVRTAEEAVRTGSRVLHRMRRTRTLHRVARRTGTGPVPVGEAVSDEARAEQSRPPASTGSPDLAAVEAAEVRATTRQAGAESADTPQPAEALGPADPIAEEPDDATRAAPESVAATEADRTISTVGEPVVPDREDTGSDAEPVTDAPEGTTGPEDEVRADQDGSSPTEGTPDLDGARTVAEGGVGGDTVPTSDAPASDRPPAAPAGLTDLHGVLQRLVTEGLSRDDLRQLLDAARAALRGAVGGLARAAARLLLAELNKKGVAYELGKTVGALVGQMITEAVLAALTAGATAAITAAKTAMQGARVVSRLAGVIRKVHRLVEPVFELVQRLRGAIRELVAAVRKWLDDVLRWMRGLTRRVRGTLRGRPKPRLHRPPGPRRRPHRRGKGRRADRRGQHRPADRHRLLERAKLQAKLMSDRMEARGRTLTETLFALQVLRLRYRFIRGFEATPVAGRSHDLYLLASRHKFDKWKHPPLGRKADLDEKGLTPEQRQWFRKRIDHAEARTGRHSVAANNWRWKRYRMAQAQKQGRFSRQAIQRFTPELSKQEHRLAMAQMWRNSKRGGIGERLLDLVGIPNNNRFRPRSWLGTRPDGLGRRCIVECKSVRSRRGVFYLTEQIGLQRAGLRTSVQAGGAGLRRTRHAVLLTGGPRGRIRPSGPLARPHPTGPQMGRPRFAIFHYDQTAKRWSVWDHAKGGWRRSSLKAVKAFIGPP